MASVTDVHERGRETDESRARATSRSEPHAALQRKHRNARLRQGLGWLSVGIGTAEIVAARRLSKWMGTRRFGVMRLLGVRELATGAALLARRRRPARFAWARVAGDVMDLGLLGALYAASRRPRQRARVAGTAAAIAGITALDLVGGRRLARERTASSARSRPRSRSTLTVNRDPAELYQAWRDFENLPRFMKHVLAVEPRGDGRWRWLVEAPGGKRLEWNAEIVHEQPGREIAWRTLSESQVELLGHVRFERAPGKRGSRVTLDVQYLRPPGGLAAPIARLVGKAAGAPMHEELRRFKRWIETGEVPTTEGQSSGRAPRKTRKEEERR
jgi:uncharacterized membrane protein